MKTKGKSINLFLMDGDSSGRIKCTIANWTGVVYKIPRTDLDKCKDRADLKQGGVYLLFGTDEKTDRLLFISDRRAPEKTVKGS